MCNTFRSWSDVKGYLGGSLNNRGEKTVKMFFLKDAVTDLIVTLLGAGLRGFHSFQKLIQVIFFVEHMSRAQRIISIFLSPTCLLFALVRVASVLALVAAVQLSYSQKV